MAESSVYAVERVNRMFVNDPDEVRSDGIMDGDALDVGWLQADLVVKARMRTLRARN